MSQPELLRKVVTTLSELGVEFMVTGSFASSLQGQPRSTHDLDLVVSLNPSAIEGLITSFTQPDYYLPDRERILEVIRETSMFTLIDVREGDKVDFWMLTGNDFDQSRFMRKRQEEMFGVVVSVSAPEDTILIKLKWSKDSGGSEKQFIDALRVYEVQFQGLERAYLEKWVSKLGVADLWNRLLQEARP